jgi:predicted PurR-regulated permease PerM
MAKIEPTSKKVELHIPFITLFKVVGLFLLIVLIQHIWPLLVLSFVAMLIAVSLEPILIKMQKRMPRWLGLTLVLGTLFAVSAALVVLIVPPLLDQLNRVVQKIPQVGASMLKHVPQSSVLYQIGDKILKNPHPDLEGWAAHLLTMGQMAIGGLSSLLLVYALTIYLLIDGRRTYHWLVAFFSPATRVKLKETGQEVTLVVSAYMIGQVVTSVLCSIFVYIMLQLLDVPGALMLSVLAGLFDVLPIIGFFLSVIPSIVFALTVSPATAFAVFGLYCAYHAVENYVIVPLIYGSRLRLSGLAVLFAILVGVALGGILGAIIILPIIASYPIIERIWLIDYVGQRVVDKHEQLENN